MQAGRTGETGAGEGAVAHEVANIFDQGAAHEQAISHYNVIKQEADHIKSQ
jgi:hypothetical protein